MLNRRRLERYPLQVRHKQDRKLILLLPQAAVGLQPGSDAGSDVVKTALSFVIQKPPDLVLHVVSDVWGMLLERGLRFVQRRRARNSAKKRDPICAWTNGIAQHQFSNG